MDVSADENFQAVLRDMLAWDAKDRLTAQEALDHLRHSTSNSKYVSSQVLNDFSAPTPRAFVQYDRDAIWVGQIDAQGKGLYTSRKHSCA